MRMSTPRRDDFDVRLVSHSDNTPAKPPVSLAYFEGKIRAITETAGRAFMDLVDGSYLRTRRRQPLSADA